MDPDQPERTRIEAIAASSRTLLEALKGDESVASVLAETDPLPGRAGHFALMRTAFERGGPPELRRAKRRRWAAIASIRARSGWSGSISRQPIRTTRKAENAKL